MKPMRKKNYLPRAWQWQKIFKDRSGFVEFYARIGCLMSSDMVGVVREDIFILPCLCFQINHSMLVVQFAWLNFRCWLIYKDWKREDAYIEKLLNRKNK
jgi:hypothetical protein